MDWSLTTKAKSDQLNADDLISTDLLIKIRDVKVDLKAEQSGVIYYEGDNGKPYKPCKSMRRVIELKWGSNPAEFIGRYMVLERDPSVKWAGEEVGGIRIKAMSHMKDDERFMLTYSRNVKRPYKVEHYKPSEDDKEKEEKAMQWLSKAKIEIELFETKDDFENWIKTNAKLLFALSKYPEVKKSLDIIILEKRNKLEN